MSKQIRFWSGVAAGIFIVGLTVYGYLLSLNNGVRLEIGDGAFTARVARTEAERQHGLSGTDTLKSHEAMLFVFPGNNTWAIWMKDMHYPIDIVWLNSSKRVVATVHDAQPSSYPKRFFPKEKARYVLELPAGSINRYAIVLDKIAVWRDNDN